MDSVSKPLSNCLGKSLKALPMIFGLVFASEWANAGEKIRIAVASNFKRPMAALTKSFETMTSVDVDVSFASSGKLYAQVVNGAPFDVFLSADASKPIALEEAGLAVHGTRFTYATGRLVLWSPWNAAEKLESEKLEDGAALKAYLQKRLDDPRFKALAIANPLHAPYGRASSQVLESLGLLRSFGPKVVRGENIAQAFWFVESGSAEIGFVALSQMHADVGVRTPASGSSWTIPAKLHKPIDQQALLLKRGATKQGAKAFLSFLRSPEARARIARFGYGPGR